MTTAQQEAPYAVLVRTAVVAEHDDLEAAESAYKTATAAFIEALVVVGWDRESADIESQIAVSLAIRNAEALADFDAKFAAP